VIALKDDGRIYLQYTVDEREFAARKELEPI
jgi:hypothetical protein